MVRAPSTEAALARERDSIVASMFHRRLLLLGAIALVAGGVLSARLWMLTAVKSEDLRAQAERRLVREQWTPTVRGRILDRKGRVLAEDQPAYAVAIQYDVLSGAWARQMARRAARDQSRVRWAELSETERSLLSGELVPIFEKHVAEALATLAEAAGIEREALDERISEVVDQIERRRASVTARRREQEIKAAQERGEELTPARLAAIDRKVDRPIREQTTARIILPRVSDAVGFALQQVAGMEIDLALGEGPGAPADRVERIPGLEVIDAGDRQYPMEAIEVPIEVQSLPSVMRASAPASLRVEGVETAIVGWMRRSVDAGDAPRRLRELEADPELRERAILNASAPDRGAYRDSDHVGQTGIEDSRETQLRGLRGLRRTQLNTGERSDLVAEPGRDVRLTIDAMLQARVLAAMSPELGLATVQPWHANAPQTVRLPDGSTVTRDPLPIGTELAGAAVVLDVDSGDILAMVSTPTFTRAQVREDPRSVFGDPVAMPFVNRAIAKPYPPGSIVKAVILNEAVKRGHYRVGERLACTGHYLPDRADMLNCWIYKRFQTTHSLQLGKDLDAADALCVSCNIFFYTLGARLGPEGVRAAYRDFGVGRPFNLGVGIEFPGRLGRTDDWSDLRTGDAIQIAIGQGPATWTPLHAASSFAMLARGGVNVRPRLVQGSRVPETRDAALDPATIAQTLEGLRRAVNDELGTGHHITVNGQREPVFNLPGVDVLGKTGTAAAPDLRVKDEATGEVRVARFGDHSWYVVLAGRAGDRPRFAVAVLIEYGGSGGKVSGPIANQILHALRAEGYL